MVHREIEIDEETDRLLTEIAGDYEGDVGKALSELVHAHEGLEAYADLAESAHATRLKDLRDRSEADFREGRVVSWEALKARNGL